MEYCPTSDSIESLDFVGPNPPTLPRKDDGRWDIYAMADCLGATHRENFVEFFFGYGLD